MKTVLKNERLFYTLKSNQTFKTKVLRTTIFLCLFIVGISVLDFHNNDESRLGKINEMIIQHMTKKIVISILILCFCNSKAQFVDPGTQAQLAELNISMNSLLGLITKSNVTNINNQVTNAGSKLLSKENFEFAKSLEEKLYKVSSFLKTGKEIKDILDIEVEIIKSIRALNDVFITPDTSGLKTEYMNRAYNKLNDSRRLVNIALDFISDNKLRMTPEGRISYLKDSRTELNHHRRSIDKMISEIDLMNFYYYKDKEKKEKIEAVMRKARGEKNNK